MGVSRKSIERLHKAVTRFAKADTAYTWREILTDKEEVEAVEEEMRKARNHYNKVLREIWDKAN
jgi:hypothetical protein